MIKVEGISKTYRIWSSPTSRLLLPLAHRFYRPFAPKHYEALYEKHCSEVQALSDINFSLESGDSLGVIGLNGSGKSTLLQIIAGTLTPSEGDVTVEGRVAALLELGSGFDPEFTGKENVYLNAAILGLTEAEIDDRYDEIVQFADIGDAIDHPVKTYSSGMMVRLAFAVQVHVEPDVLIVDEALAVGDARFQAKALNKLDEILARGTTLLFVGHDLNTVKSFCRRAILLDHGHTKQVGLSDDVIASYLQLVQQHQLQDKSVTVSDAPRGFSVDNYMVEKAEIEGYGEHAELSFGSSITINMDVTLGTSASAPYLIFDIIDAKGLQLTGRRIPIPAKDSNTGRLKLDLKLECCFQQGVYRFRFRIVDAPSIEDSRLLSRQDDLVSIHLVEDVRDQFTGIFPVPIEVDWQD